MRCLSIVISGFLLTAASILAQSAPTPLHDGQQVTLTGRLAMEPSGRLQFVTVKTAAAYVPVFKGVRGGKDEQGKVLHEIGLAGYSDYATLYAHRGQQVRVTGKLATDNATPYFWQATRLQLTSLRLANGTDLLQPHAAPEEPIAVDAGSYNAEAVLPADLAAPWVYSAHGEPAKGGRFLTCSSNGGGDVVNCSCADGFHPVSGTSSSGGHHSEAQLFEDGKMAQFEAGDDKHAIELSVTCSR